MNKFIELRNHIYEAENLYTFPLAFLEESMVLGEKYQDKIMVEGIQIIKQINLNKRIKEEDLLKLLFSLGENPYLDRYMVDTILGFSDRDMKVLLEKKMKEIILKKDYNCQKLYHLVEICIELNLDVIEEDDLSYMLLNYKRDLDLLSLLVDYVHHFRRGGFKDHLVGFLEDDYPGHIKIQLLNVMVELYSEVKIDRDFLRTAIRHDENKLFYDSYVEFLRKKIVFKNSGISMIQSMFYGDFEDSGKGNNGGLAVLLKSLGDELSKDPEISFIFTITIADHLDKPFMSRYGEKHVFLRLPIYMDKNLPEPFLKRELFIKRSIHRYLEKAGVSPDIFHIRFLDNASKAMASLCKELNKTLAFTLTPDPHRNIFEESGEVRAFSPEELMEKLNKIKIGDELLYRSDGIVGIGNQQVQEELKIYFPQFKEEVISKKLQMIGEGIQLNETSQGDGEKDFDLDEFMILNSIHQDFFEKPIILNVGRLAVLKGQMELLKAWTNSKLSETHHLLIIGGDLEEPTKEERKVMDFFKSHMEGYPHLKDKFFHKGAMSNDKVRFLEKTIIKNELEDPHLYLCSSLKEEFGIAILEAMSQGFLVLAPMKGGVKSYLKDGVNGFLIDTSSGENMARQTEHQIYKSKRSIEEFKKIQKAGQKTVDELFSVKKIASNFLSFYLALEGVKIMNDKHVFFISPPFYSHFNPMLVLAKSFKTKGLDVTFGCSREFEESVLHEGLNFYEIDISSNKNVGKAESTDQPDTEKKRLEEFFESTKRGAIETLITQSHHRKADMLYNPQELIDKIKIINETLDVDFFVVDILSYSVTLGLYFLDLPFITFCPPHPNTIPGDGAYYGVPLNWPSAIKVEEDDLRRLKEVSRGTQKEFTEVFNTVIAKNSAIKETGNAFGLISERAVIYNYFDFNHIEAQEQNPKRIFAGNCFKKASLDAEWVEKIKTKEKKILISLGTFLSNRKDVLEKLIVSTREIYPEALIIVSAGSNAENLRKYRSSNTIIEGFIPQIGLMPYMDTVIFHGGCNTFTEAMYYGKDMIILPFSSDQFNIAFDVEKNNLGKVLDPNGFSHDDLVEAFNHMENMSKDNIKHWSKVSKERGTDYAVKKVLDVD